MIHNGYVPFLNHIVNCTATKSFTTVYTNTTGKTLIISISGAFITANAGERAIIIGRVNNEPMLQVGLHDIVGKMVAPLILFVPPGDSYKIDYIADGAATVTIDKWMEMW